MAQIIARELTQSERTRRNAQAFRRGALRLALSVLGMLVFAAAASVAAVTL